MEGQNVFSSLPNDDDVLITSLELPRYVPVSTPTLDKWRCERRGPRFVKMGRIVAYRAGDVRTWLRDNRVDQTNSATA
jgi:predicted DNA-binding transcriptional regulator AlpA